MTKKLYQTGVLLILAIGLSSCMFKRAAEAPVASDPGVIDPGTTTPVPVVAGDVAPVAVDQDLADVDPGSEITVQLSYTDTNSDQASTCTISGATWLTESTPCSCTAGVCTVGVTHDTTYSGDLWGEFFFTVTANSQTSNSAHVYLTTKCPSPTLATGATLTKNSATCPSYSGWSGTIAPADILVLQEGNVSEGGYILAFDSDGCYKGRATSKETPWYAVGLKIQAYANSIPANNEVKVIMHTMLNGSVSPIYTGAYEWSLPFSSQTKTLDSRTSGLSNAAKVPDDNNDGTGDAHLTTVGGSPSLMRYSISQLKSVGGSDKMRYVADNVSGTIKGYINGVEKTECQISLAANTKSCTNCVGHSTNTTPRYVTDIFIPNDSWAGSNVNYAWYETRTVGGLPRDVAGVSKMGLCRPTTTGLSSLSHSDVITSAPSSSTLVSSAVIQTRTIPNNVAASNDIYANMATIGSDYVMAKFDYNSSDSSYKRVCSGFQGDALGAYQNHFDVGSTPYYGDLFTIEKDALGIHIRKYGVDGSNAGKLKATLFTDSLNPSSATAFKQSTTLAGQWIVVVPNIPAP